MNQQEYILSVISNGSAHIGSPVGRISCIITSTGITTGSITGTTTTTIITPGRG